MRYFIRLATRLFAATALASLIATTATADIKSENLWNSFTRLYGATGITLTATQTRNGDTLNITDFKATTTFPDNTGSATFTTDGFTLIDNPDGTVTLEIPASVPVAFAITVADKTITGNLSYDQTGHRMDASGTPEAIETYYDIDRTTLTLTDIQVPNRPNLQIEAMILLKDTGITTTLKTGAALVFSQVASGGSMDMILDIKSPTTNGALRIRRTSASNNYSLHYTLPLDGISLTNLPEQLRNGLALRFTVDSDWVETESITSDISDGGQPPHTRTDTYETATAEYSASKDGLQLTASIVDRHISGGIPGLTIPFEFGVATTDIALNFPLLSAPDPQDLDLSLVLGDFTLNEEIWALFDLEGLLPRDPATLAVDFSAKVQLLLEPLDFPALFKLFDRKFANAGLWAKLSDLTVNALRLKIAGADFTGTGAVTFDYNDITTIPGMPAPIGNAQLRVTGAYALLENLIKIGLVNEDNAESMYFVLNVFWNRAGPEDILTTLLEVNDAGNIIVNGMHIR